MLECTDRTIIICAQNYNLKSATLLGAGVPPWNNECSCPSRKWVLDEHSQNNGCSTSTPKIMGARRAPIFQGSTSWTYSFEIPFYTHMCSFICSPFDCSLDSECSCPSKRWVLVEPSKRWVLVEPSKRWVLVEPPKIMGALPHFSREHFMNLFLSCPFCICSIVLCLAIPQTMSARAPLSDGCSCPLRKWVLDEHS